MCAKERDMYQIPQTWRDRYGIALLMVAIGTIGIGVFMALIAQPMFILYIMPIAKATCIGGFGSGLVAAALALLVSNYLFLPPYFSMTSDRSLLPLVVCYLGTVVISALRASRGRSSPR
jgi:K+-sensing histidine kinase KdpD